MPAGFLTCFFLGLIEDDPTAGFIGEYLNAIIPSSLFQPYLMWDMDL